MSRSARVQAPPLGEDLRPAQQAHALAQSLRPERVGVLTHRALRHRARMEAAVDWLARLVKRRLAA
jgi:hypothetical protein